MQMFRKPQSLLYAALAMSVSIASAFIPATADAGLLDFLKPGGSGPVATGDPTVKTTPLGTPIVLGTTVTAYNWPSTAGDRNVIVYKPNPAPTNAPVVLVLHALSMTPQSMAALVRAGEMARDSGYIVILPSAINAAWNNDPATPTADDDVGFLTDILARSVPLFSGDPTRRFIAGYSSGGFMANRMACERTSMIAGIASNAASIHTANVAACPQGASIPIMFFHGTSDFIVPYAGTTGIEGADNAYAFWRTRGGCGIEDAPVTLPNKEAFDPTQVVKRSASGCTHGGTVVSYQVISGGHTWPNSAYAGTTAIYGNSSKDVDATVEIQNFFNGLPSKAQ